MSSKEISILKLKCIKKRSREALKASNVGAKGDSDSVSTISNDDNDIRTSKIWLFDYSKFKMRTDEFPLFEEKRTRRRRRRRRKKLSPKAQHLKSYRWGRTMKKKLRTAHEAKSVFYLPCLLIKGVFAEQKYKTHLLAPLFSACSFRCLRSRCCLIHANESLRRRKRWVERYLCRSELSAALKSRGFWKNTSVASSGGRPSGIMNNFNAM